MAIGAGGSLAALGEDERPPVPGAWPVADLQAKPAEDWSRFLLDLLPAIAACLDATPGPAPRVTKAWPMNRGMAGARTRNGAGGWFDCIAPSLGGEVDRLEPVTDGGRLPGEGTVVFSPVIQGPPPGECYQHERALGPGGEPIGWLSTETC
jgi:putative lipoprotein